MLGSDPSAVLQCRVCYVVVKNACVNAIYVYYVASTIYTNIGITLLY